MPFYNLTQEQYNQHQTRHQLSGYTYPVRYCLNCFPVTTTTQIPDNYQNFWTWIRANYGALNYTCFALHAFNNLETDIDSGFSTKTRQVITSIEFQDTSIVSLFELTF